MYSIILTRYSPQNSTVEACDYVKSLDSAVEACEEILEAKFSGYSVKDASGYQQPKYLVFDTSLVDPVAVLVAIRDK